MYCIEDNYYFNYLFKLLISKKKKKERMINIIYNKIFGRFDLIMILIIKIRSMLVNYLKNIFVLCFSVLGDNLFNFKKIFVFYMLFSWFRF